MSLITLIFAVTIHLLAGRSADLTDAIGWLCKFRIFVLFASRTDASRLITLATIDRCLSSSVNIHRRQMSTLKNAHRDMIIVICLSNVIYAQLLYCFEANLTNTLIKWYGKTLWCRLIYDLEFIFLLCCYSFISDVCLWIDGYYRCLSSSFASNTTCHCDSNDSNSTCR